MPRDELRLPERIDTYGEALNWARHERGRTLRQLADEIGVSASYIVDMEHDRRPPAKVNEIAKALNVNLADLQERAGCTRDLKDWLSKHPKLIRLLRDIQAQRCKPTVMKALGLK